MRMSESRSLLLASGGMAVLLSVLSTASPAAPPRELQIGMPSAAFQAEFKKRVAAKFAPLDFSSHYSLRGKIVLAAIWEKREVGQFKMKAGLSRDDLEKEIKSSADAGYRLEHLTAMGSGGAPQYSAIWSKTPGQRLAVRFGYPEKDILKLHREFTGKKHAIHRIMTIEDDGHVRYTAAWEQADGDRRELQLGVSDAVFQREIRNRPKTGFRLRQAFAYVDRRRVRIACIWEKAAGPPQEIRVGLTAAGLQKLHEQLTKKGFVPAQIHGYAVNGRDRYIAVWEKP
jgi:Polyglycine hydrolase-like, structural repeat